MAPLKEKKAKQDTHSSSGTGTKTASILISIFPGYKVKGGVLD